VKVQKVNIADTHSSLDVRWHRKRVITLAPAGRRASGRKRSARQIRTRPHRPHQLHRQISRRHFAGFQPSSCSGQSRPHSATRGLFLFLDLNVRLSLLSLYTTVVCVARYNPEATLPYFTVDVFGCTCISSWDSSTTNVFITVSRNQGNGRYCSGSTALSMMTFSITIKYCYTQHNSWMSCMLNIAK